MPSELMKVVIEREGDEFVTDWFEINDAIPRYVIMGVDLRGEWCRVLVSYRCPGCGKWVLLRPGEEHECPVVIEGVYRDV